LTAAVTSSPAGAQDAPALSFGASTPVSITSATAGTATLTISSTAATSSALVFPGRLGSHWRATGAVLACFLFFGVPTWRRKSRAVLGLLVLFVIATAGVVACGSSGGGGTSNPGTTAGSYTVTVTATSGATTQTGTVALTVQ
jgi:hypothetical protein